MDKIWIIRHEKNSAQPRLVSQVVVDYFGADSNNLIMAQALYRTLERRLDADAHAMLLGELSQLEVEIYQPAKTRLVFFFDYAYKIELRSDDPNFAKRYMELREGYGSPQDGLTRIEAST